MGKSSEKAPQAPNYGPLLAIAQAAAAKQYGTGDTQQAWANSQFGQNQDVTNAVNSYLQGVQGQMQDWGKQSSDYMKNTVLPSMKDYSDKAQAWGNEENQQTAAGQAVGNVAQQFNQARTASQQQLESYGVNPGTTRMASMDIGTRLGQAAAGAGQGTMAAQNRVMQGMQLQAGANQQGLGLAANVLPSLTGAAGLDTQQLTNQLATTSSGASTMGTGMGWTGLGNAELTGTGNMMNQQYQNQVDQFKADQASSSGTGALLGAGAGLLGSVISKFALGGPAQALPVAGPPGQQAAMQPPPGETPGGAIPMQASPTGGQAVDDVPAALTAGEFVLPKDVTSWLGEKHLQQQILKARQEKQKAQAKPEVRPAVAQQPNFISRPQQGALPTG